jgi:hypothetical protein
MTFHIRLYEIDDTGAHLKCDEYNPKNRDYLCQDENGDFPLLSDVDPYYPMKYDFANMPQLIPELEKVKLTLADPQDIRHVEKIINLCKECELHENYMIVFSAFDLSSETANSPQVE